MISGGASLELLAAEWNSALERELGDAVGLRHELHANPGVSGNEHNAASRLEDELRGHVALEHAADAGRIGRLGPAGRTVGLRAELDALPLAELTMASFASTNGAMHACGHDVHQAALVAVIRAAKGLSLPVGIVAILQPREETYPSGALDLVQQDALRRFEVAHVIGAHVHPDVPLGAVATGAGFINAAADEIRITVRGDGGHGAYPHQAADPVAAIAQIALGLPEVVRRTVSPLNPAIISIGTLTAGQGAANVLPAEAAIVAAMRTTAPEDREALFTAVRVMATHHAKAYGVEAEVLIEHGEPVLINDAALAAGTDVWLERLGIDGAEPMRSMGADDFSYFCQEVPSVMCFVGVKTGGKPSEPPLHHPEFLPTDEAVGAVARALLAGYLAAAE
ncbi:MAG TPA: amidohydrolase, partial [Arenibaculum sp.]|nr:amidohydrolase [Arenibaculum sp.]